MARSILYVGFLAVFAVGMAEVLLRLTVDEPDRFYVYPPNLRMDFVPSPEGTPGVEGIGRFWTNRFGIRSNEPPAAVGRVVYALGGSTTIDIYLDQEETWVAQLEQRLNTQGADPVTWIGNLGRTSLASVHNLVHMHYLVPTLPRAHFFLNLVGVNDLQLAIKSSYVGEPNAQELLFWSFSEVPLEGGFWNRFALGRFVRRQREYWRQAAIGVVQTTDATPLERWRVCRRGVADEALIRELPPLRPGLRRYRRQLHQLVDRAAAYGAPMVFLTQPTLWREEMGAEERDRLLAGGVGPSERWCDTRRYYHPGALADGMRRFNGVLREVCAERRIPCIDLAAQLPPKARFYRDDMHFSEAGAARVAEIVEGELRRLGVSGSALP